MALLAWPCERRADAKRSLHDVEFRHLNNYPAALHSAPRQEASFVNIHYIQHVPFEGISTIKDWATSGGHSLARTRLWRNDALPTLETLDWLIVMGGPMGVHDEAQHPWLVTEKPFLKHAVAAGKVIVGICLGAQLLADALGARVYTGEHKEIGWFPIDIAPEADLVAPLGSCIEAFHWHGDTFDLPLGAELLASSAACANQAFLANGRQLGLQFHLEPTFEGVQGMIEHGSDELVSAPYIQSAEKILDDPQRFEAANRLMHQLLDRLVAATQPPAP